VAAWLFDGIHVNGHTTGKRLVTLLLVAAIIAIVNAYLRPVAMLLSLPAIILTLGLFIFVVNALMLLFVSWLAEQADLGFRVDGFWTAVFGAIVISIVSWAVNYAFGDDRRGIHTRRYYRITRD
jgi:putative membrane protein